MMTFSNKTSRPETYPVHCTVLDCAELIGEITLLPHTTVTVLDAICGAPRITQRHAQDGESGNG